MSRSVKRLKCCNPQIGRMLPTLLATPRRLTETNRTKVEQHVQQCRFCWDFMAEHAAEAVIIPHLRKIARWCGVSFEQFVPEFVERMKKAVKDDSVKRPRHPRT